MFVEREVDGVFAETCIARCVDLRQNIGTEIRIGKNQIHQAAACNVVGLEDGFKVRRVLGMNHRPFDDRQDALLHVLQHRLNISGLLLELERAFLNLLDHAVERHNRMADFVHAANRHPAREVLAGRDLAHHGLHTCQRTRDLAIEQRTNRGQQNDRNARDNSNRRGGRRERAVQRRNRFILLAILFDAQRLNDAFEFVAILRHVREQIGLREFVLAGGLHLGRVVDSREIVFEAVGSLGDQTLLRVACGITRLQRQRLLQGGLLGLEFVLCLRDDIAVRRID